MKKYINKINQYIEKSILNYIDKVTRSLYPKPKRVEASYKEEDDEDDPILFI